MPVKNTNGHEVPLGWLPLADIPNQHGYRLAVKGYTGATVITNVVFDPKTGQHRLAHVKFESLVGWKPMPQTKNQEKV